MCKVYLIEQAHLKNYLSMRIFFPRALNFPFTNSYRANDNVIPFIQRFMSIDYWFGFQLTKPPKGDSISVKLNSKCYL